MAFDVDVLWKSEAVAEVEMVTAGLGARLPISVRNVRFEGTLRVIFAALTAERPGYGALLVSLPVQPKIGLDVRVAGGEVTKLPWLRAEIEKAIELAVAEQLLWPRRLVVPADRADPPADPVPLLTPAQLQGYAVDDPLLQAERAIAEQPVVKERRERAAKLAPSAPSLDILFNDSA